MGTVHHSTKSINDNAHVAQTYRPETSATRSSERPMAMTYDVQVARMQTQSANKLFDCASLDACLRAFRHVQLLAVGLCHVKTNVCNPCHWWAPDGHSVCCSAEVVFTANSNGAGLGFCSESLSNQGLAIVSLRRNSSSSQQRLRLHVSYPALYLELWLQSALCASRRPKVRTSTTGSVQW